MLFDIRNANRASLPPIVDLAKFRPHDLPTLQPLTMLTETCLELDHELAYSSIAEVETSPLDILSIPCNKFGKSTDDGFEIECKKFLSNVWTISTEDRNKIEVLTRGQSNNKEWFNQRAGKLLITKLVSIPNIILYDYLKGEKNVEYLANVRKKETLSNGQIQNFYKAILTILINSTKEENIIESR